MNGKSVVLLVLLLGFGLSTGALAESAGLHAPQPIGLIIVENPGCAEKDYRSKTIIMNFYGRQTA